MYTYAFSLFCIFCAPSAKYMYSPQALGVSVVAQLPLVETHASNSAAATNIPFLSLSLSLSLSLAVFFTSSYHEIQIPPSNKQTVIGLKHDR